MPHIVEIDPHPGLEEYEEIAQLAPAVAELRAEAKRLVPALEGRSVWMLNSTAQGGGVAEMLPAMIYLLRELGLDVRWAVLETDDAAFFPFVKRLHNLIHGFGETRITSEDRERYDRVSRTNAGELRPHLDRGDILIVHDPQPLGTGALLQDELGLVTIWRCHIGLDRETPETQAAWAFLEPYARRYDHSVFSIPEYIPSYLAQRASVIHPGLDPLSHKNRNLPLQKLVGILVDSGLVTPYAPVVSPSFPAAAERLQPDGRFAAATEPEDIGLLFRPIATQVSRWDRLKGFAPLLEAFTRIKRSVDGAQLPSDEKEARRIRSLRNSRLVLAGPDPGSIQDDPEATAVLDEIRGAYLELDDALQRDIAVLSLPMRSRKHNALMVNALQRSSTILVQNSLQEGFGLTATEAMWKGVPILASGVGGLRYQVRDALDGCTIPDPEDPDAIAAALRPMLEDPDELEPLANRAQRRVQAEFLIFTQLRRWLEVISSQVAEGARARRP